MAEVLTRLLFVVLGGGPFMEDSEFDHKMLHMLRREVEHLMLRPPHHEEPEPDKPRSRRKKPPAGETSGS